jgi:hypothetical protein
LLLSHFPLLLFSELSLLLLFESTLLSFPSLLRFPYFALLFFLFSLTSLLCFLLLLQHSRTRISFGCLLLGGLRGLRGFVYRRWRS